MVPPFLRPAIRDRLVDVHFCIVTKAIEVPYCTLMCLCVDIKLDGNANNDLKKKINVNLPFVSCNRKKTFSVMT